LSIDPQTTRVGWIGTGVMGLSMCGHVLDAGYPVTVHNRTRSRAEPLLEKGAAWADTPAEVAAASDVVCSIVGYPADVREVILGDDGALAGAAEGSTLVDLTTSEPSLAVEIAEQAAEKGIASKRSTSATSTGARRSRTTAGRLAWSSTTSPACIPSRCSLRR